MSNLVEEIYGKNEPLDEELAKHVEDSDVFGKVLRHPLGYMIPFIPEVMGGVANKSLKNKKELIAKAIENHDFERAIWFYERPYRLQAVLELYPKVLDFNGGGLNGAMRIRQSSLRLAKALRDVWTDSENIWQNYSEWAELLEKVGTKHFRASMEDEDDIKTLERLPEVVEVYRGGTIVWEDEMDAEPPFSWTLDKERADWFARRFKEVRSEDGFLMKAHIPKEHIYFYTNARKEREVVVDPSELVVEWYEEVQ